MLLELRSQITRLWTDEVFILVDQALLRCEIFTHLPKGLHTWCVHHLYKQKNDRENRKICYQVRIEGPYPVEKLQRTRGNIQSNRQIRSQVGVGEAPNKTQE